MKTNRKRLRLIDGTSLSRHFRSRFCSSGNQCKDMVFHLRILWLLKWGHEEHIASWPNRMDLVWPNLCQQNWGWRSHQRHEPVWCRLPRMYGTPCSPVYTSLTHTVACIQMESQALQISCPWFGWPSVGESEGDVHTKPIQQGTCQWRIIGATLTTCVGYVSPAVSGPHPKYNPP